MLARTRFHGTSRGSWNAIATAPETASVACHPGVQPSKRAQQCGLARTAPPDHDDELA